MATPTAPAPMPGVEPSARQAYTPSTPTTMGPGRESQLLEYVCVLVAPVAVLSRAPEHLLAFKDRVAF